MARTPSALRPAGTRRFQDKREAILNAATQHFNQHGIKGATLAQIAGSVGLVTNSVTYYYRKKEDLACACLLRAIETFASMTAEVQRGGSASRVGEYLRRYVALLAAVERGEHPPLMQFHDLRALPSPHFEQVSQAYTAMFRQVRELLRADLPPGLGGVALNARTYGLLSVVNWGRGWIDRYESDQYELVAERLSDIVLHGIGGAGSVWSPAAAELDWRLGNPEQSASEAFLRAASALINEQGDRGASVEKISASLELTKGSFYHHNEHKEDLILECFDRSFCVIRSALSLADAAGGSGWERLGATARTLARFQLSADGPWLRLFATSALSDATRRAEVRKTMLRLTKRVANVVVDGMMDGSIRPLDPYIAAQIVAGTVNAAAGLRRWVPAANQDNVAELFVRPFFTGLLHPAAG